MLLSYSLDIRRVNLFPVVTYVSYAMSVTLCQLRYVSYVMFLFNPNVTYLEYSLSSTAGYNDGLLGRWLVTR